MERLPIDRCSCCGFCAAMYRLPIHHPLLLQLLLVLYCHVQTTHTSFISAVLPCRDYSYIIHCRCRCCWCCAAMYRLPICHPLLLLQLLLLLVLCCHVQTTHTSSTAAAAAGAVLPWTVYPYIIHCCCCSSCWCCAAMYSLLIHHPLLLQLLVLC